MMMYFVISSLGVFFLTYFGTSLLLPYNEIPQEMIMVGKKGICQNSHQTFSLLGSGLLIVGSGNLCSIGHQVRISVLEKTGKIAYSIAP